MTDTSRRSTTAGHARHDEPTAWAGWVAFGGVMLIMMGTFQLIQGLVALFDDGFYAVNSEGLLVEVNYNTWGWIHLAIGLVGVLVGVGLLAGNMAARIVGVAIAFLSALVNLAFIPAYPVWSLILIGLDIVVIYAITAHGREVKRY